MSKKSGKSAPKEKEVATYNERDIVLGKVRGFPPWPGMVVDPDSVPPAVQQERPGKKSNFYCVQFFPAGDYAWLVPKDISKLQHLEIEAYINEPYKKSGELLAGYRTALDPAAWEAKRAAALAALDDDDDDDEDGDGEDGEDGQGDEEDELVSEGEGGRKKRGAGRGGVSAGKKRKRESMSGYVDGKTRKGPKEREREKEKEKKDIGKKAGVGRGRAKGRKGKSSALVESEDDRAEGEDDAEGEDVAVGLNKKAPAAAAPASPPPAKKQRREEDPDEPNMQGDPEAIKVRDWRHKLQKAFLSAKTTPDDADMPTLDTLFSTVEAYESMTVSYLQFSKIGKVMRHITLLEDKRVPRDGEFRFRARAQALVEKWQSVLGAAKGGVGVGVGGKESQSPKKEEKEKEKEKEEKEEKEREKEKEGVVNGLVNPSANSNGAGEGEEPRSDLNGAPASVPIETTDAQGDVDMAVPMDADAPGEADGEGDVSGQADAPGEAEDAVMNEA